MKKLFMAEDDKLMTRLYERAFSAEGYEFEIAKDGEEALEKLSSMDPKPSAIILDVMMPKKDGFAVLEEIKKDPALKAIPVIMLTNLSGEEDRKKALSMGAAEYLVKSNHIPDEVVAKVRSFAGQ